VYFNLFCENFCLRTFFTKQHLFKTLKIKNKTIMKSLALISTAFAASMEANPIRKVVMLLQDMQKEIEEEGRQEEDLYEKFMCYCKGGTDKLDQDAADAVAQYDQATAQAKADSAEKAQLDGEVKDHKKDRADAKSNLATATELRNKEHETYVHESGDTGDNLESTKAAIAALSKGMGSFLQSSAASSLKKVMSSVNLDGRDTVLAFLSKDYAPQGGEIVGILKDMADNMEKSLGELHAGEDASAKAFEELSAAKRKEIQAATDAIESKSERSGKLAVSIVQNKGAAADATRELDAAKKFVADLAIACKEKTADWEERSKTRAEELAAVSQAIGILNEDDALEVFSGSSLKKPAVKPVGFLQKSNRIASAVSKARVLINDALTKSKSPRITALNLLAQAVVSKMKQQEASGKVDFSVVLKMIDDMIALLKTEQADDEKHRDWCNGEFHTSEGEHKDTTRNLNNLAATISELKDAIEQSSNDIAATQQKIADLDKSVAEATAQRQAEHAEYQQFKKMNEAAKQLIFEASNRLQKFYNPQLYVAPKERELSRNDQIFAGAGGQLEDEVVVGTAAGALAFTQMRSKRSMRSVQLAPEAPVAPDSYGAFEKKSGASNSVLSLMEMLTKEVDKGLQEAEHNEKTAQRDYENLQKEASETRATDVENLNREQGSKAQAETDLQAAKEQHIIKTDKLKQINDYIADLHASCDFILTNFEMRREARTNERNGLENAKAVLSGADYA
jgi:peptidoglycan hydrolase CwlO-like protein